MKKYTLEYLNESVIFDTAFLYFFIKKLTTPFEETDAFKLGIIDENGNILIKRRELKTREEKNALTLFDVFVFNLKKLLEKLPGGKSKFATYAASLFLLREQSNSYNYEDENLLNQKFKEFYDLMINTINSEHFINEIDKELDNDLEEEPIANNIGSGTIQTYDPVLKLNKRKKFKDFR